MGKRGPKKTPTAILKARGSREANGRPDLRVHAELPDPPGWLSPAALAMWHELAPLLYHAGVLTRRDRYALARYCRLSERWLQCEAQIDDVGQFLPVKDKDGNLTEIRRNPLTVEAGRLAAELRQLETAFGMTASSRSAIGFMDRSESSTGLGAKRSQPLSAYKQGS